VPKRCTANNATITASATGGTQSCKAGAMTPRPSTAPSTVMAGVMTPSP
jgi:hypothetical protein